MAEMTLNIKKTHSERLMPLIDRILTESGLQREQIGAVAAAAGPGSFTGLRIGVATARALAQGLGIPAVPVCTLSALAEAVPVPGILICPLLDARRGQVYGAVFRRITPPLYPLEPVLEPEALALSELLFFLKNSFPEEDLLQPGPLSPSPGRKEREQRVVFLGEGLHSYEAELIQALPGQAVISQAPHRLCRAALVALRGRNLLREKPDASYLELLPRYLRRPEAERLAQKKRGGGEG